MCMIQCKPTSLIADLSFRTSDAVEAADRLSLPPDHIGPRRAALAAHRARRLWRKATATYFPSEAVIPIIWFQIIGKTLNDHIRKEHLFREYCL